MKKILLSCTALVSLLGFNQSHAAGFYIQESSVSALGYAFAGSVTSIDDATAVFFNPASMTELSGPTLNAGFHIIKPNSDLTDSGSGGLSVGGGSFESSDPYDPSAIPNLFFAMPVTEKVWIGGGITAPFGLASEYDSNWFGRFDAIKTELTTINYQASLAAKVTDNLSLSLGLDYQTVDAELTSAARVTTEGTSKLEGEDSSLGYNLGLLYKLGEETKIGASYRSAMSHTLDGRITASGTGGGDFSLGGTADLNLPDIATLGVSHDIREDLTLMAQATWFGWGVFQEIQALSDAGAVLQDIDQGYQNTWAFAVGAEYDYSDRLKLRLGFQFDETPTTDEFRTTRTPDGDRTWIATGFTYDVTDKWSIDGAATYIDIAEERVNVSRNGGFATVVATNEDPDVYIVSFAVSRKF